MASPHQLLNTSWTSHRLSPLHYKTESESQSEHGSLLNDNAALETYAARLRDHLTGSLFGAQGWRAQDEPFAAGGLSAIGALQSCTWEVISSLDFIGQGSEAQGDNSGQETTREQEQEQEKGPAGLLITLSYETATYKAALLAAPGSSASKGNKKEGHQKRGRGRPSLASKMSSSSSSSASIHLPLLLTRFPKPLKEPFIAFLASTFDTYVSDLRISSAGMCGVLERYIESLNVRSPGENENANAQDVIREMHLTLSFAPPIAPSLKALNVNIPRETVGSFLRTPSSSSSSSSKGSPLLSGLSAYLQKQLSMEFGSALSVASAPTPGEAEGGASVVGGYARLTKIACAGFVVTAEGRLKVVVKGADGENERNQGALRGGQALLRSVLERAGMGLDSGRED